mmetsp:Transcript_804/g.1705  ORF Transcript_804/g.1705 Transcript_804/m.1705 type:complete len:544 (-) Transcript_804:2563-4194(-)
MDRNGDSNDHPPGGAPQTSEAMAMALTEWSPGSLGPASGGKHPGEDMEFSDLFSVRRPKNVVSGVSSGAQSMIKGVAAGAATLIAAPVIGAQQEGTSGFFKGLGAGLVGAVLLPVVGCSVGAAQMVRGVWNTPESISENASGKRWDQRKREWVVDNLVDDSIALASVDDEDIFAAARERAKEADGVDGTERTADVHDTGYYEVLQVPPTATQGEIKRSYYILARQLHPDKNPGDEEAHTKFQALGEAYQVLSNEDLRVKYDQSGKDGLTNEKMIDATAFFAMLFGSERFDHLVGRTSLATMAAAGAELKRDEMRLLQERREQRLAVKLAALLQSYLDGGEEVFVKAMGDHAADLAKASFGVVMLHTVGVIYESAANQFMGSLSNLRWSSPGQFFSANLAAMQEKGRTFKSRVNVVSSAIGVYKASVKMKQAMKDSEEKEKVMAEMLSTGDILPAFVDALWSATVIDIENTLVNVCQRVLFDHSVEKDQSIKRAKGLRRLGKLFQDVKGDESEGDVRSLMEAAMMRAMGVDVNNPHDDDADDVS